MKRDTALVPTYSEPHMAGQGLTIHKGATIFRERVFLDAAPTAVESVDDRYKVVGLKMRTPAASVLITGDRIDWRC